MILIMDFIKCSCVMSWRRFGVKCSRRRLRSKGFVGKWLSYEWCVWWCWVMRLWWKISLLRFVCSWCFLKMSKCNWWRIWSISIRVSRRCVRRVRMKSIGWENRLMNWGKRLWMRRNVWCSWSLIFVLLWKFLKSMNSILRRLRESWKD